MATNGKAQFDWLSFWNGSGEAHADLSVQRFRKIFD